MKRHKPIEDASETINSLAKGLAVGVWIGVVVFSIFVWLEYFR